MSKSIASYPEHMRPDVVRRRLARQTKGNGYWAAVDAAQKLGIAVQAAKSQLSEVEKEERAAKRRDKAEKLRRHPRREGHKLMAGMFS